MRRRTAWLSILTAILAVVCFLFARVTSREPFGYDEADYMYAGTQGFWANYSDRNALSLVAYVQKGLELARDKTQRLSLSQYVRVSEDITFYRHYHGPTYAYWLALWHRLGVRQEATYRATGLMLHALTALAIFCLFLRVFPGLPPEAAFVAGVVFAMNRTALVTATNVTQHVLFEAVACFTLFTLAAFLRTGNIRYWYACAILMALAFAVVEIAVVLIASVTVTVLAFEWRRAWKPTLVLIAKGAAWFLGTLAVLWPKGVFELNALKGYLYLAYIARYRKTFNPIGPMELWGFKLRTYPSEYVLLALALAGAMLWFAKSTDRRATAPFLAYACFFLAVTMVITVPYTHYHASFIASLAVLTGVVFGELWTRSGAFVRFGALAVVCLSLIALDVGYYRERVAEESSSPGVLAGVLSFLSAHPMPEHAVFVPQLLTPTLHYYMPAVEVIAYDADDSQSVERLVQTRAPALHVFCAESLCRRLETVWITRVWLVKQPVGLVSDTKEMLYAATIRDR
jgi:hypothetical protein